jgi:homoserine kinase type II
LVAPLLRRAYGLDAVEILDRLQHRSVHFVLRTDGGEKLLLSSIEADATRIPFAVQFAILRALAGAGWTYAREPVPTRRGAPFHSEGGRHWVLKPFSEQAPTDWSDAAMVVEAAKVLAAMHAAAGRIPREGFAFAEGSLHPFHWDSLSWAGQIDRIWQVHFHKDAVSAQDLAYLEGVVARVARGRAAVAGLAAGNRAMWTVTHQDFRLANICCRDGRIVEVWDWDLARIDLALYDVAFAALQFGGRECLFSDVYLSLADTFICTYLECRADDAAAMANALPWFLEMCILKRALMNWHVADRIRLLRKIEAMTWSWC